MFDEKEDYRDETVAGHVDIVRHHEHLQTSLAHVYHVTTDVVLVEAEVDYFHGHGPGPGVAAGRDESVESSVQEREAVLTVLQAAPVLQEEVGRLLQGPDSVVRLTGGEVERVDGEGQALQLEHGIGQ